MIYVYTRYVLCCLCGLFMLLVNLRPGYAQDIQQPISNIFVESGDVPNEVWIRWEVSPSNRSPILVKRSKRPMSTARLIREGRTVNVSALTPQTPIFVDRNVPEGVYYYAVITWGQRSRLENLILIAGQNYTQKPFIVIKGKEQAHMRSEPPPKPLPKKPEPKVEIKPKVDANPFASLPHPTWDFVTSPVATLDLILANTYLKRHYGQCVAHINHFLNRAAFRDPIVKAKALFFLGLCNYKLGKYHAAMSLFSDHNVQDIYPQRSYFWFQRSVARLKQ